MKTKKGGNQMPPFFAQLTDEPSRTRTCDPLVKSQLLYQLSYRPVCVIQLWNAFYMRGIGVASAMSGALTCEPSAK